MLVVVWRLRLGLVLGLTMRFEIEGGLAGGRVEEVEPVGYVVVAVFDGQQERLLFRIGSCGEMPVSTSNLKFEVTDGVAMRVTYRSSRRPHPPAGPFSSSQIPSASCASLPLPHRRRQSRSARSLRLSSDAGCHA